MVGGSTYMARGKCGQGDMHGKVIMHGKRDSHCSRRYVLRGLF